MKRSNLIGMLWACYLGAAITGFFGATPTDIRWWLTFVPIVILTNFEKNEFKKED